MPTATINPNVIDFNRIVPPIMPRVDEDVIEYDDPLTPEEEKAVAIAEAQIERGEYDVMRRDETLTEFLKRIGKIS